MSLASWFSMPQFRRAPALNKAGRRPSHRQPIHSRPTLEHLEERTLLSATGLVGGANNPVLDGAAASSGNLLPIPTSGRANGANPQHDLNFAGRAIGSADADSSSFLAQDQLYGQFRLFGVNSQGDDFQLGQRTTANILRDAFGFGSGVMPNAPWMPKAYSVGLANHQFGYPSQTDMGFSAVAPSHHPVAQTLPKEEQNSSPIKDEEAAAAPEQLATHCSLSEQEQSQLSRLDKDASNKNEDVKNEDIKALLDQLASDKNEDMNAMLDQLAAEKLAATEPAVPQDGSIPDSLWLSALAPAPMAALVAGLPGIAIAAEDGDVAAPE